MFVRLNKRYFKMENACIYCGRPIDAYGTFKDLEFCSERCRTGYKMEDKKRRKRKRDEVQPAPVFDLMYA